MPALDKSTRRPVRTPCPDCAAATLTSQTVYVGNPAGSVEKRSDILCKTCGYATVVRPWQRIA